MTGEESELSQRLCESLLVSETHLHPAGEEAALGACGRLRLAVDTLLELLNQANAQVCTQGLPSHRYQYLIPTGVYKNRLYHVVILYRLFVF